MTDSANVEALTQELRASGEPFVIATVVRTLASVAAKPGAKAIIAADGRMAGWIGGGCALGAVRKAAKRALEDGQSRLISVMPFDQLQAQGLRPGEERDGIEFAKNMCPSRGVIDVFIEPMLPKPLLILCGATPVAVAIADLAPRIGFAVAAHVSTGAASAFPPDVPTSAGFDGLRQCATSSFIVIATQGGGDEEALAAALGSPARYVAFVGSRRKVAALKERLVEIGIPTDRIGALRGPAGISIGAVTPEEIALSVLADVVGARRHGQARTLEGKKAAAG